MVVQDLTLTLDPGIRVLVVKYLNLTLLQLDCHRYKTEKIRPPPVALKVIGCPEQIESVLGAEIAPT